MDIEIILAFQHLREITGEFFTDFFLKMTFFGELNTTIILLALVYWCIDKTSGQFLLLGWNWVRICNGFLKVTVCAYRPWIRSAKVVPNATALATATGYSFPSGHSMNSSAFFGGIATKKDAGKSLRILALIMMLMVALSRVYLGVHTPQDVLVGILLSSVIMTFSWYCMAKYKDNDRFYLIVSIASVLVSILVAVYATFKSYPVDYDANGKILVEGIKMAKDTFKGFGWNLAFFSGLLIERKFINFSSDGTVMERVERAFGGIFGLYIINLICGKLITKFIPGNTGTVLSSFLTLFYVMVLYPYIIKRTSDRERKN